MDILVIVDTHVHAGLNKYEPIEVLTFQMELNGITHSVLIQYMGNTDNRYLLECLGRFPGKFSAVGLVDTGKEDATNVLEYWFNKGIHGVRLGPKVRSPGIDPLDIWRKAEQLGMIVSSIGIVEDFAADGFRHLVRKVPDLKIVIEHLGGVGRDVEPPYSAYLKVLDLARYPNIYMKVPGFGEICHEPFPYQKIPPLVNLAYDAFGASRLMWGSDFPPVSSREGYHNSLHFPWEHITFANESEKEWIFGKTALSVWNFG